MDRQIGFVNICTACKLLLDAPPGRAPPPPTLAVSMPEPLRLVYWLLAAAAWPRPAAACDAGQRPDGAGGCENCPEPGWTSVLGGWAPLLAAQAP